MRTLVLFGVAISSICLFAPNSRGQIWVEAAPLMSSREDIIKIQVGEVRLDDGSSYFELKNENVTVTYYGNGCDDRVAKELNLSSNTVIQIKSELKYRMSLATLLSRTIESFERIPLESDQFVYINHETGFVVIAEREGNMPELVKSFYHVPKTQHLAKCLLALMDTRLRNAFERSDQWKTGERVVHSTSISLDNLELTSVNIRFLNVFGNLVNQSDDHFGYIYVYSSDATKSNATSKWIKKLEDYFDKALRIEKSRLRIVAAGSGVGTTALLIVKARSIR